MLKFFQYKRCSTCRNALKWLDERGIEVTDLPIRDRPPTVAELVSLTEKYGIQKLFNSSGQRYRELGLKEVLTGLSEDEKLKLIAEDGHLARRPILLGEYQGTTIKLVGFNKDEWQNAFDFNSL
jgi:arsenate reductase